MLNKNSQLLARVNYPLYTVQTLTNRHILVAGGGGGAKTGIRNVIEIYELIQNGRVCHAVPVTHYETGDEAVMNCTVYNAGSYFLLFAGMEGNCQMFKIRQEVEANVKNKNEKEDLPSQVPPLTPGTNQKMTQALAASFSNWEKEREGCNISRDENSLRKRKNISEDSNEISRRKESHSSLQFKIQRLETFQTDFSDEPFQKLVRFSPTLKLLVTGGADGHVRLWKHPNMNKVHDLEAHSDDVDDLDFSPDGKKLVSVSRDGHGKVWSTEDGRLITELKYLLPEKDAAKSNGRYIFRNIRFGIVEDKNDLVLFGTLNPAIRKKPPLKSYLLKWDTKQFALEKMVSTGSDMLSAMAISDDGHFLGVGTQSGGIKIFIGFSLQLVYNVDNVHGIFVTSVNFLPTCEESRRIAGGHEASLISISVDNHIIIHNIPVRASMSFLSLLTIFLLTLLLVFVIMDYFNL